MVSIFELKKRSQCLKYKQELTSLSVGENIYIIACNLLRV